MQADEDPLMSLSNRCFIPSRYTSRLNFAANGILKGKKLFPWTLSKTKTLPLFTTFYSDKNWKCSSLPILLFYSRVSARSKSIFKKRINRLMVRRTNALNRVISDAFNWWMWSCQRLSVSCESALSSYTEWRQFMLVENSVGISRSTLLGGSIKTRKLSRIVFISWHEMNFRFLKSFKSSTISENGCESKRENFIFNVFQ